MCLPDLGLSVILPLIGGAVSAVGTVAGAQAQSAAASFRAKQERILAEDALKRGVQQEDAQRRKTAALYSRQRAVLAASNADLTSGSPLAILSDTATLGELDAAVIQDNAKRQQQYHNTNAQVADAEGKNAWTAGIFGAFNTALGTATSMADKWYKPFKGGGGDPWAGFRTAG